LLGASAGSFGVSARRGLGERFRASRRLVDSRRPLIAVSALRWSSPEPFHNHHRAETAIKAAAIIPTETITSRTGREIPANGWGRGTG
jgi:hypothetical protein